MKDNFEQLDLNKIAVEFINSNLKELTNLGKGILKGTKDTIQFKLKTIYTNYLRNVGERYGKSKSFFIRDEPQPLDRFFVPMGIESSNITIKNANIRAILSHNLKSIIVGTAGSGKSMLLKYLLIDTLKYKKRIPIFIELRDYSDMKSTISDAIKDTFDCFGLDIEMEFINKAFSAGHFIIFLDGLDEVTVEKRIVIVKEIDAIVKEFPKMSIILTSRPDSITSELQSFSIFNTLPMDLKQSVLLIQKLPADDHIKKKFIKALENGLFKKHSSFLSNPLLLTIMLLTYGYSTDIPSKLSVFYNQAFEALFQRHDTMKGAYKRIKETNLDIQDFEKVLNVFCIQTYDDRKIRFSRQEAIEYLGKSKQIINLKFNSESFLNDLLQSVCILVEEGLFITFSHRSFQEYFAAKFIVSSESNMKKRLLKKYQPETIDDNIYKLVHELDPDFLEYEIILPFLSNLFDKINLKNKVGITHFSKFCKIMWEKFHFRDNNLWGTVNTSDYTNNSVRFIVLNLTTAIEDKYFATKENEIDWLKEKISKSVTSNSEEIYHLKDLKYNDEIIVGLFSTRGYFGKALLTLLVKVKANIENKRTNKKEKLEEILFKKD